MTVAVEMITYNHKDFIRKAIESVLCQETDFEYKIYIFDDCSTDGTTEICREYAQKNPSRIALYANGKNLGITRNARFMHEVTFTSGANYIAICEGDDYWEDKLKLQRQVDFLEKNQQYGIICSAYDQLIDSTGEITPVKIEEHDFDIALEDVLTRNFIPTITVVFRGTFCEGLLPLLDVIRDRKWPMGDYPMWLHILGLSKGRYLSQKTAVYRVLQKSASGRHSNKAQSEFELSTLDVRLYYIRNSNLTSELKRKLSVQTFNKAFINIMIWNDEESISKIKQVGKDEKINASFRSVLRVYVSKLKSKLSTP